MTSAPGHRSSSGLIMGALWLAEVTAAFETAMIYSAVGQLIKTFGDPIRVGWLITVYLLVGAAAAAIVARLGDLYGRRRLMLILLAVTVAASLLSALSSSFALILVGRGVQGLAAAMMPLCFGLARENLPPGRVPIAVGVIMSGASGGTMLGLIFGGLIVDTFGWHAIFYASAGFAAASWLAVRLIVPRSPRNLSDGGTVDFGSALLFVPGIVALLLAISNGKTWGWASPGVLGLVAVGILMLVLWVRRSLRIAAPLIDVRLFRRRPVAIANLSYALVSIGGLQVSMIFAILLQSPRWTGMGLGMAAAAAGLVGLPSNILAFVGGPISGYLTVLLGGRLVMAGGGLLSALGWTFALFFHSSVMEAGISLCIIAMGTAIMFAAGPNVVIGAVPPDRTSEATGMLAVVRSVSMGVGTQLVAVLLATSTVQRAGTSGIYPSVAALYLAIAVIIGLTFAAALVALLIPGKRRDDAAPA